MALAHLHMFMLLAAVFLKAAIIERIIFTVLAIFMYQTLAIRQGQIV